MPVTRTSKTPAPQTVSVADRNVPDAAVVDESPKIALELGVHKRYVLLNQTYEANVVYEFTAAQAKQMLLRKSDTGLPVFKRYVPREKRRINTDGMTTMDMRSADLPDTFDRKRPTPQHIEVGSVDDLRAEGVHIPDDDDEGVEV